MTERFENPLATISCVDKVELSQIAQVKAGVSHCAGTPKSEDPGIVFSKVCSGNFCDCPALRMTPEDNTVGRIGAVFLCTI